MKSLYTLIELAAFYETRLKLRKGDALFRVAFARIEDVPQVFPKLAVDPQIDLNRDPFPVLIGNELNSSHISIMPHLGIPGRLQT